ncbi:hypothetical protein NE237_028659 [Protea cynaroides]|uniref:MADS-box domain-containing protein n=1 Tax=Protea cynaroides TaxID=273540 RepID=A0A9Q0JUA8_9MAGN|nr:hypothetical protein NE237_028659 [Protea cynaroides]
MEEREKEREGKSENMKSSKRRVQGLKKKIHELATLCGVDAFLVSFYEDGGSDQNVIPITYPENPVEVRRVMKRYRDQTDLPQNNRRGRRQQPADDTHQKKRIKIAVTADSVHEEGDSFFDGFTPVQLEEILKSVDSELEKVNELLIEKICDSTMCPETENFADVSNNGLMMSSATENFADASNCGWMRCFETENLVDASNQDSAPTSKDLYDLRPFPPTSDLGFPMPMPCSCSYNDPILPYQLQKEKRNLWEPSPAQMYCMITMLKRLENGECLTTVLEWGNQFLPKNGLGPSISLPYSCDSMGYYCDP